MIRKGNKKVETNIKAIKLEWMKQKINRPKSSLIDSRDEGFDSVNHVIDQAFNYLGHCDQLKRLATHLNWSTIKHTQIKVLNGLNLGLKLEDQISEFNVDLDQNKLVLTKAIMNP